MLAPERIWIKKQRYGSPEYYKDAPVQIKRIYEDDYEYIRKPTKCGECGDSGTLINGDCKSCLESHEYNCEPGSVGCMETCQCTKDPYSYYSFCVMMESEPC